MKRSSQVALLLMGTMSVGAGAYALMPSENCQPNQPGAQQSTQCAPRSSSSSSSSFYGGSSGRSSSSSGYLSQNLASGNSASSTSPASRISSQSTTSRGGFGSFASHFTGGG